MENLAAPVQRQLDAYNAKDLEAFIACYSEDCVIEDAAGQLIMQGRDSMRQVYGQLFAKTVRLHAAVPHRIVLGQHVVDEERVEREFADGRSESLHVAVVYRVEGDLIRHVRFVR